MLRNFSHSMESKEGRQRNKAETKQDSKEFTIMYHVSDVTKPNHNSHSLNGTRVADSVLAIGALWIQLFCQPRRVREKVRLKDYMLVSPPSHVVHSLSHRCLFLLFFPRVHAFRTGLPDGLRKDHFSARQVQVFFCDFLCSKFRLCIALSFAHQSEMERACEMIQALLKTTAATQRTPYHPLLFFVAASSEGGSGARLSLSGVVC